MTFPIIAYAGYLHRRRGAPKLIGYGGLCWRFRNPGAAAERCDIWFDTVEHRLIRPLTLVRWARRMIKVAEQLGDREVYCVRDDEPNSAKLLELAGLRLAENVEISFEDGSRRSGEVWQRSLQSAPLSP